MRVFYDETRKRPLKLANRKGHFSMHDIGEYIKVVSNINRSFHEPTEEIVYAFENGDLVHRSEIQYYNIPTHLRDRYAKTKINKNYYGTVKISS